LTVVFPILMKSITSLCLIPYRYTLSPQIIYYMPRRGGSLKNIGGVLPGRKFPNHDFIIENLIRKKNTSAEVVSAVVKADFDGVASAFDNGRAPLRHTRWLTALPLVGGSPFSRKEFCKMSIKSLDGLAGRLPGFLAPT